MVVVTFHSSLMKVGDHGTTDTPFSPTLPISYHCRALRQSCRSSLHHNINVRYHVTRRPTNECQLVLDVECWSFCRPTRTVVRCYPSASMGHVVSFIGVWWKHRSPARSEDFKFYPLTFFLFLFLSIHRAQQPRSGWPSHVFRSVFRSQKVRNLASFSTSLNFEPPAFENVSESWNTLLVYVALCIRQVWWSWVHTPLRTVR